MYRCTFLIDKNETILNLLQNQRIQKCFVYLNNDIFFELGKDKKFLHISLNFQKPFVEITNYAPIQFNSDTSFFFQNIKKYCQNARILTCEQLNNDRILSISLTKMLDNYDMVNYTLIIELFTNHPNLIIINNENTICFAKHYSNIENYRLILNGSKYALPNKDFDLKNIYINNGFFDDYLKQLDEKLLLNKYISIFKLIKNKRKQLTKRISSLTMQIEEMKCYDIFKDAADYILCNLDDKKLLIDKFGLKLNMEISLIDNANIFYKKYKKTKKGLEIANSFLEKANEEYEFFERLGLQLENANINDMEEIKGELISSGYIKDNFFNKTKQKSTFSPYYIEFDETIIAFGKNNLQNNKLTFSLAKKDYYFFHIKDYSGSHIVVYSNNPSEKVIKIAAEVALFLSKKDNGDIQLADIKDVKKINSYGKVSLSKYETITIHSYDKQYISDILKNAKRFDTK